MKILKKWSHCSPVCFLTALLFCAVAICSPYSQISVTGDIIRGRLGSASLIHSCTVFHFMACWPGIPYRVFLFDRLELYDSYCSQGCCFSSQTDIPTSWGHLFNYVTKALFYHRIWTLAKLYSVLREFPCGIGWVGKLFKISNHLKQLIKTIWPCRCQTSDVNKPAAQASH